MWVRLYSEDARTIAHYLGVLVVGIGAAMVVPLVTALSLLEFDPALDYVIGIGIALLVGAGLMLIEVVPGRITRRQALLIAALGWLAASLVAAVPFALSGNYASYLDAVFDSLSGLTTSGLTLAIDLDHMAYAHNMWRHLLHLIGGQGIIVAAVSLAVGLRSGAFSLYQAEGREERILPNVVHTTRFIWFVTAVFVVVGTVALTITHLIAGMDLVRSSLQAFWMTVAAYDTGGFAPQSMNALYYHSAAVEFLTMLLMLGGTLNFSLHADVWRGDLREIGQNLETRTLAFNMVVLAAFAAVGLVSTGVLTDWTEIASKGVYHVISAHSGTGHQSIYPAQWQQSMGGEAMIAVILAMAAGGSMSSTAGGIKALRIGVIVKAIVASVKRSLAPDSAVVRSRYHHLEGRILTPEITATAMMLFILYAGTYVTGGIIGAAYGFDAGNAMFESVSAAANVGLSTGITSPGMPALLKITYIVQMWAGRLEFIALFVLVAGIVASLRRRGRSL